MPIYKHIWSLILMLFFITSCKTIFVNHEPLKITKKPVSLLSVGLENNGVLENGFNTTAIPVLKKPIRVMPSLTTFNKKSFKAYTEATKKQPKDINITYIDSLPDKPRFINLQIIDQVELANQLNSKHNSDVKNYMSTENSSVIIKDVSIAFKPEDINAITSADKLFLVQDGKKSHVLKAYSDNKTTKTIKFSEGIVFAYKTTNCCWQEDEAYKLQIVGFVDGLDSCPNKTYKSAQRAKKKINYFKL